MRHLRQQVRLGRIDKSAGSARGTSTTRLGNVFGGGVGTMAGELLHVSTEAKPIKIRIISGIWEEEGVTVAQRFDIELPPGAKVFSVDEDNPDVLSEGIGSISRVNPR